MKVLIPIFSFLFALSLFGASSGLCKGGSNEDRGSGSHTPMAEMMFYEAAEQAAEDSYAVIIPKEDAEKTKADNDEPPQAPAEKPVEPTKTD